MPTRAKLYAGAVIVAGVAVLGMALANFTAIDPVLFSVYLGLTILASALKMRLPGVSGTYSLIFVSILIGLRFFSLQETLIACCAGALVQTYWKTQKHPTAVQAAFNMANLSISTGLCFLVWRQGLAQDIHLYRPALLALVTIVFFLANTFIVSGVLSLLEGKTLRVVGREWYPWSFPYYLTGACVIGLFPDQHQAFRPESLWLLVPMLYLLHFYVGLAQSRRPAAGAPASSAAGSPPMAAKYYAQAVVTGGAILVLFALLRWETGDAVRFAAYLALGLIAATLKIRLPGLDSSMSILFVLSLVFIAECTLPEAIVLSAATGVVQSLWKPQQRPSTLQVLFNGAAQALSVTLAFLSFRFLLDHSAMLSLPASLAAATTVLYVSNAVLVAVVLCLIERRPLRQLWSHCYFWSFPYYLVGTAVAGLMIAVASAANWYTALLVLPVMGLVYVSYALQVTRHAHHPAAVAEHRP
ncbi:MAG TPA: hypothetical protein VEU96_11965 [Bryobacteraceae bacterium]|nr:hypothetical protein [Bryobacteraceae bacterium]